MYAKVFKSMFDGTLRGRSDQLLVFVNLLASADRDGYVDRHFTAISQETGLSVRRVKQAIAGLEAKDTNSRSPDAEGRRIQRLDEHRDWGWKIVNYVKYRDIRNDHERREQNRVNQANRRERLSSSLLTSDDSRLTNADSASVSASVDTSVPQGECEGERPAKERVGTDARVVLHYLNEKSGRHFREVGENLPRIQARLNEPGVTVEGVKQMIDRQVGKWKGDSRMEDFLRPETLFGKQKFDGYYAAKDQPIAPHGNNKNTKPNPRNAYTYPSVPVPREPA